MDLSFNPFVLADRYWYEKHNAKIPQDEEPVEQNDDDVDEAIIEDGDEDLFDIYTEDDDE